MELYCFPYKFIVRVTRDICLKWHLVGELCPFKWQIFVTSKVPIIFVRLWSWMEVKQLSYLVFNINTYSVLRWDIIFISWWKSIIDILNHFYSSFPSYTIYAVIILGSLYKQSKTSYKCPALRRDILFVLLEIPTYLFFFLFHPWVIFRKF